VAAAPPSTERLSSARRARATSARSSSSWRSRKRAAPTTAATLASPGTGAADASSSPLRPAPCAALPAGLGIDAEPAVAPPRDGVSRARTAPLPSGAGSSSSRHSRPSSCPTGDCGGDAAHSCTPTCSPASASDSRRRRRSSPCWLSPGPPLPNASLCRPRGSPPRACASASACTADANAAATRAYCSCVAARRAGACRRAMTWSSRPKAWAQYCASYRLSRCRTYSCGAGRRRSHHDGEAFKVLGVRSFGGLTPRRNINGLS
jgi:hypothetical protein